MVHGLLRFIGAFAIVCFAHAVGAAVSVVDDIGRTVILEQPAQRLISLSPHITELTFAAGAGQALVGVVQYSDYPAAAQSLPLVGNSASLDLETILRLKPDLIIAWRSGNPQQSIERLEKFNIPVFFSEPRQLDDIASNIERIGALAGTVQPAQHAASAFRHEMRQLESQYANTRPVRVFYQIWDRPLVTVNGKHLISAVLNLCGGINIFADLPSLAPEVGMEYVITANPDVIVASGSAPSEDHGLAQWKRWPNLRAAHNNDLYFVEPDDIQRATPRMLKGARRICELLDVARAHQTQ